MTVARPNRELERNGDGHSACRLQLKMASEREAEAEPSAPPRDQWIEEAPPNYNSIVNEQDQRRRRRGGSLTQSLQIAGTQICRPIGHKPGHCSSRVNLAGETVFFFFRSNYHSLQYMHMTLPTFLDSWCVFGFQVHPLAGGLVSMMKS